MKEPKSYEAAQEELDSILAELQAPNTSLDDLTAHVQRAGELLTWCRTRLRNTEEQVRALLDEVDGQ